MCLFRFSNKSSLKARMKGVEYFECGACPECMQKKARQWALRACMEAKKNVGFMCTLTYDTYKYDEKGNIIGENLNADIPLSKRDCQLFIKRLREYFPNNKITYIGAAERGKRTNRPHYHFLIFGVQMPDLIPYKKSKRGNLIYRSKTLEKLWQGGKIRKGGICTVDCNNINAATARYCTKYCAKDSGIDDTFMLFSRGIGEAELLRRFNGLSYWVDGREYPIPRQIWQKYIENKYSIQGYSRYKGKVHIYDLQKMICAKLDKLERLCMQFRADWIRDRQPIDKMYFGKLFAPLKAYERSLNRREIYFSYRDNDYLYKRYLAYWKRKASVYESTRPDELSRICSLPNDKYRGYKAKAIKAKYFQLNKRDFVPPRSNSSGFLAVSRKKEYEEKSFAPLSRHYTANDSFFYIKFKQLQENKENGWYQPTLLPVFDDHEYINPFVCHYSYVYSRPVPRQVDVSALARTKKYLDLSLFLASKP